MHKLSLQQRNAMFAIEHCRTSVLGGHIDTCDACGHTRIFYNSCRNRHCPKCQGLNRIKWVDKLSSTLLPVRYFHIVFTIPAQLNALALCNQECVYDILFKAASESLQMLAKDSKYLDAATGIVAVLHTWGQNLMHHPHLHTMIPAGGWNETAQCWKDSRRNFFIPVKVISAVFRGKFLSFLKEADMQEQLKFYGEAEALKRKSNFKSLLNELYEKPWVVYAKKPFKNASHIIKYLGRYTHRIAISNHRIESIDEQSVSFTWKDYKDHGVRKTMTLPGEEFIRRFLLHILPKGFCKIRYFGIFACRSRQTMLVKCREFFKHTLSQAKYAGLGWQQALQLACGINVMVCPVCKKGNMVITSVFVGKRAPP
jgi:hypothetical protein